MADEDRETLRRLEERLERASERAERLIDGAASRGPRAEQEQTKPPPAGWQVPGNDQPASSPIAEFEALVNSARALRELVPPEVAQRLAEALKEVLMAIRALIDWYVERLDRRPPPPPEVTDIPIQ